MERLAPESQMMEETDSLGISALSFEDAMSAALTGEGWVAWRCCFCFVQETFQEDMQLSTSWVFHKACRCLWGLVLA